MVDDKKTPIDELKTLLLWVVAVCFGILALSLLAVGLVVANNNDRINENNNIADARIIGNCYDFNESVDRIVRNDVEQARANARGLVKAQEELAGVHTPKDIVDRYLKIVSAEAEATSRENNPYRKCTLKDQNDRLDNTPKNIGCTGPAELGYCLPQEEIPE